MKKTLQQLRTETPGCSHRTHLNNAGTALPPQPVLESVQKHLALEAEIGGYEAESQASEALERVYGSLARLLGCRPEEIALAQNATRAWDMIFYGLPLSSGDKILTCRCEYASNFIAFLQRQKQTGAEIVVLDNDETGAVCLESLREQLDSRVKIVAINHIPTNGGLVQPVEEIGRILSDHPAFYLVDACQSVGQYPVDVQKIGCHALTATSRKYLRGPRGLGFLYIQKERMKEAEPPFLDLHAATWVSPERYELRDDARRFETYEIFVAGKLGLGRAADYALEVGLEFGWERLSCLAATARRGLGRIEGVTVHDLGQVKGGIVTFSVESVTPEQVRDSLQEQDINIWTCTVKSARLDMEARDLSCVARASFHYYNTEGEVEEFLRQIQNVTDSAKVGTSF